MHLLITLFLLLSIFSTLNGDDYLIKDNLDGKVAEKKNIKKPITFDGLTKLKDEYGLSFVLSYMILGQYDIISEEDSYGGRFDFITHYAPTKAWSFGLKLELENAYGDYTSGQFANEIGSLNKVSPGYADFNLFLKELWADYKIDKFSIRAGIINTNAFVDKSFYNNFTKFYMSHASSSKSYGHMPLSSLGIGAKYTDKKFYINAVASDSTAHTDDAVDDIKDSDYSLYSSAEFGLTPDKNIYFINVWTSENKNDEQSYGLYLSLNQYLNAKNKIFAKLGTTGGDNVKVKQHASFGWSLNSLFDDSDLLLTAIDTSQDDKTSKYQTSLEVLYKYTFNYGIELSGDLQVITNPMAPSQEDWILLPGIRARMVF